MIDLAPQYLETVKRILAAHVPDAQVRAFGSRYTWTAKDYSDLDLAIVGAEKLDLKTHAALQEAFEESNLPFRVDVLDWHAISPEFRAVIQQGYEVIQKPRLTMSSKGWSKYIFSDFVIINPAVKLDGSKDYSFVEMRDLNEKSKYVYPSAKRKLSGGSRFQNDDTLFARITPCLENGKICQVKGLENSVGFGSTEFLVFRGREGVSDNDFIFYLSRFGQVRRFAEQNMLGTSGRQRVTREAFDNLELDLPPLPAQLHIANILSALDDKIELNRQTNDTLEATAQAIFKEWFVDFNFPGATGQMQESELGMIPQGWRVLPLDEIAEFLNGLALQKFPAENEDDYLPVIKIRELKNGITNSTDKASRNIPSKYIVHDGDLIFSWSASLEVKFWVGGEGALNQHLFKVTSKVYPLWFCYYWVLHHITNFRGIAEDKTTTMGHIQRHHLSEALCLIPDHLSQMDSVTNPLIDKIINLEQQTATLATLRDVLLPKLMSGEIEV